MDKYNVTGMSCAACSARVEKAVSKVEGVTICNVNLLTNSMQVEGTATPEQIMEAVKQAGYGASLQGAGKTQGRPEELEDELQRQEMKGLAMRLYSSLAFLAILMYISMGYMMWEWPLFDGLATNPMALALTQMLLTLVIMVINQRFFIRGFKGLFTGAPNMDTLVALGSAAAFVYSTWGFYSMTQCAVDGNLEESKHLLHSLYYESAGTILTLITLGKLLEARSKGKTTDALKGLMKLAPKTATVISNGVEQEILIEELQVGDEVVIRPGEVIPADGIICQGSSGINEASLTGESVPVDKQVGDTVQAGTINLTGRLCCRVKAVGENTTLSQIIQLVQEASSGKAPIAKVADRVSGVFVPAVLCIALVTTCVWLLMGQELGYGIARGIAVLVISCPCALGLATPVAIMVGNGIGARTGILFKQSAALEEIGKASVVAVDKTGTITKGEMQVAETCFAKEQQEVINLAYSLEQGSEHPLGKAICQYARENQGELYPVQDFEIIAGCGLKATVQGELLIGGTEKYIRPHGEIPQEYLDTAQEWAKKGITPVYLMKGGEFLGVFGITDGVKEDSALAVEWLKKMGLSVVMITGDQPLVAEAVAEQVGIEQVIAGVLPGDKERVIQELQKQGKVIMVGDGINDAPALTRADVGIAIGAGTDIAIDAAQVVLMKNKLTDVVQAIALGRNTLRTIYLNLFWAFFYNAIGIPLAAGVFSSILGWELNPMFAAAAMSMSSVCVVSNALLLNYRHKRSLKSYGFVVGEAPGNNQENEPTSDKIKKEEEIKKMKKTMNIQGMMCGHCEARVKKCLEQLPQVTEAVVSHEAGTAVITLSEEISNEELKALIEAQDYTVVEITETEA